MLERTIAGDIDITFAAAKLRILFVEDNAEDAEMAEHALKEASIDFTSRRVENREEYLHALKEFSPDLIISDYDLPQFSGTEALELSKTICPDVPFILMTGAVGEERAIEILTGGATDYVMKNRLSRLAPAVGRALNEANEHKERKRAEAERDQLLHELEDRVRQRTAELQESEMRFRMLFETIEDAIIVTDPFDFGRIISVNPAAGRLFGYSEHEFLGLERPREAIIDTSDPNFLNFMENRDKEGSSKADLVYKRKDGSKFIGDISSSFFTDRNGNRRVVAIIRDITERKRAEQALNEYKDKLESKIQERTALLSETNRMLLIEIAERKKTEEVLRSAQKKLRAMASEIVLAEERSRQHFAAELHDTVVQTLGAAKLRSQLIQNEIPERVSTAFSDLQEMISRSIAQSRQIMAELSPPVLNELGFVPALEWLAEQVSKQHGIDVDFKAVQNIEILHQEVRIMLFQAARELLVNVVKHSRADKAIVKITGKGRKIRIEVTDNGTGFDKNRAFRVDINNGGFGLFSIRERLKHFGGNLIIQSREGKGTRIIITSPMERLGPH